MVSLRSENVGAVWAVKWCISLSSSSREDPESGLARIMAVGVSYIGGEDTIERGVDDEEASPVDSVVCCLSNIELLVPGELKSIGPSKSQATPCLEQFPQTGCNSSHCRTTSKHKNCGMIFA